MRFRLEKDYIKNENRFVYTDITGRVLAQVDFSANLKSRTLTIDDTVVDESFRGRGIASQLMETMVNYAKKTGNKLSLACSYAKKYFGQRQAQYSDLLK